MASKKRPADPTTPPDFDDVLERVARDHFAIDEPRQNHVVNTVVQTRPFAQVQERVGRLADCDPASHAGHMAALGGMFRDLLVPVAATARHIAEAARALGVDCPPEVAAFEGKFAEMAAEPFEAPAESESQG